MTTKKMFDDFLQYEGLIVDTVSQRSSLTIQLGQHLELRKIPYSVIVHILVFAGENPERAIRLLKLWVTVEKDFKILSDTIQLIYNGVILCNQHNYGQRQIRRNLAEIEKFQEESNEKQLGEIAPHETDKAI